LGVLISLIVSGFPVCFPVTLSYVKASDRRLRAPLNTLGASPWQQFRQIYLPRLMPGLTWPRVCVRAGRFSCSHRQCCSVRRRTHTRDFDSRRPKPHSRATIYSLASAIAMVMGFVQVCWWCRHAE